MKKTEARALPGIKSGPDFTQPVDNHLPKFLTKIVQRSGNGGRLNIYSRLQTDSASGAEQVFAPTKKTGQLIAFQHTLGQHSQIDGMAEFLLAVVLLRLQQ